MSKVLAVLKRTENLSPENINTAHPGREFDFRSKRIVPIARNSEFRLYTTKDDHPPMHIHLDTLGKPPHKSTRLLIIEDAAGKQWCEPYPYCHSAYFDYEHEIPPAPLQRKGRFDIMDEQLERAIAFANQHILESIEAWDRHAQKATPLSPQDAKKYTIKPNVPLFPEEPHIAEMLEGIAWQKKIAREEREEEKRKMRKVKSK